MMWHSMFTDPPPIGKYVLFFTAVDDAAEPCEWLDVGRRIGDRMCKAGGEYQYPTHWMELPEPPKEK